MWNVEGEEIGKVGLGVVERVIESRVDWGGDEVGNGGVIKGVKIEVEVGEGGGDCGV